MRVIGTECKRRARMYYADALVSAMLLKNSGRYDKGPRRRAVVMEAGGLPGQPADHPYVMVGTVVEPLIPSPFGAQPHFVHPSLRGREHRHNVGQLLRRFQEHFELAVPCGRCRTG